MPASFEPPGNVRRHPRSARGGWTIAAIFAVGALVLTGLWLSPRAAPPAAPPGVAPGTPGVALGLVLCDLRSGPHTVESVLSQVRATWAASVRSQAQTQSTNNTTYAPATRPDKTSPDYVLLVGVEADEITDLAGGLGMRQSYHPQLFQRAGPARGGKPVGVCVLSRYPLYEGARVATGSGPSAGVCAVSVVGGKKFLVACVDLAVEGGEGSVDALLHWADAAGDSPLLVGGVFDAPPSASTTSPTGPSPAVEELVAKRGWKELNSTSGANPSGQIARTPPLLATPQWTSEAAGIVLVEGFGNAASPRSVNAGGCSWVVCH